MKLILEHIENVKYLVEERDGQKHHFIEGVFMQSEKKNRNGRMYPKGIMEREVSRYKKEYIDEKRAFGELGHPDSPSINLDRVSHMIVSLEANGNDFIGKAKILGTPYGNIVKNLIDEGAKLGVSSRGMGSLKPTSEGYQLVQDDFYLATAADIVADPSAPDAFVRGIMENKEWIYMNGVIQEIEMEQMKNNILKAKGKQLEEVKLRQFTNFISKL
jgi:hypothetical protein